MRMPWPLIDSILNVCGSGPSTARAEDACVLSFSVPFRSVVFVLYQTMPVYFDAP